MSGRGDNNKHGSSGRGASNQSNQPLGSSPDKGKSTTGDQTGGRASEPDKKKQDQSSNRDKSTGKKEK